MYTKSDDSNYKSAENSIYFSKRAAKLFLTNEKYYLRQLDMIFQLNTWDVHDKVDLSYERYVINLTKGLPLIKTYTGDAFVFVAIETSYFLGREVYFRSEKICTSMTASQNWIIVS